MTEPIISIDGVNHYFGSGNLRKQILFGATTIVEPGEVVIMTGPSGSGKTTLLTLIGALRSTQEGSLKVLGQELLNSSESVRVALRRNIGYIFQAHNLLKSLTTTQNVMMALELHTDLSAKEREEMASYMDEALSEVTGVRVLRQDPRQTARSVYCYIFAIDPAAFGADHDKVCDALRAEGARCGTGYPPMNRYELFQPHLSKLPVPSAFPERFQFDKMYFDTAERLSLHEAVWLGESTFRAGKQGVEDVVAALKKVQAHAKELTNPVKNS